jgi:hypothetical protein
MTIITRRRDQRGFTGNPIAADQIVGGIIVAETREGRDAWIDRLTRTGFFNYFVKFTDVNGPALQFGFSEWAYPGRYIML